MIVVKTGSDGKAPGNELKEHKEGEILLFALEKIKNPLNTKWLKCAIGNMCYLNDFVHLISNGNLTGKYWHFDFSGTTTGLISRFLSFCNCLCFLSESTGKDVNEETPFMSQKEEDGSNE